MKNKKITQSARGQECQIQLHPYCNGNAETTVFCHAPSEDKGIGFKSPDWWGAYGCSDCHDVVDGRRQTEISSEEVYRCHIRGVYRTLGILDRSGLIKL